MDCGEEDDGSFGIIPEFGAIFMSSTHTKKECLKRRIFALPYSQADFVTRIKSGTVLFLFEFQRRQLFGVYQASSDGALDILPHAFNYSGKHFPAQVRFRQIWYCDPLSETEFRDAIRENYFSANKFKQCLSQDQVRRLLYLFSSKKMKNRIPLNPRSEAIVEEAAKDRRWVGGSRHELSERGYRTADEYDEMETVAFSDHHVSSFARGKEDEVLIDDRNNAEGKGYPFPRDDFLAKKRRIGEEGRLTTNSVTENGLYSHGYRRTFCTDSPKETLDEVRRLTNSGRLLAAQMVNENQLDKIHTSAQSSDHFVDQLDARAHNDYAVMQRSTLSDDYNMHDGYRQAFASDHYGVSVGQGKNASNDDRFLLDDCVKRDYNINVVKSSDSLNLFTQTRGRLEDHEWLMNRKLENLHHLDCDGSSSAFDPSASLLHNIRKTTAAGRFQIDEHEPDFGACAVEGFSSRNILRPLQCGYRNNEDMSYPNVEGRSTENMVNKVPPILATTGGYVAKEVDARFQEVSNTHTNPIASMMYPSFSQQEQNSFSDNLFPEKHLSQLTTTRNFDPPHYRFDDATITRAVPYLPDHHNYSHGCSRSIEANQNSTLVKKTYPHGSSLGNFYPPSSNRPQQYILESENFSRPQDSALEFGNIGPTSTSGLQTSLPQEYTNSFVNQNFFMDIDLNTSAPVNYNRGSLSSRLSPPCTDLENVKGEKGLVYYSKSGDNHFSSHGNISEPSEHHSQHVQLHGMGMLAGREFGYSESEDLGMDICQPETDLAIYENQHFRFSSNMNRKELHKTCEANSIINRRSVFTRLSSKVPSRYGEERNDIDVNHQDIYVDATADEVMEMLHQDDGPSPRKLRKSRVAGQPRESAVNVKKTQCNMETDHSKMEKKKLKSASQTTADSGHEISKETHIMDVNRCSTVNAKKTQSNMETDHSTIEKNEMNSASHATADSMDEIQRETRTLDFKRRSDRRKNSVGMAADSASHSKPTDSNEVVKSSMSSTLRRKKLVRPVFSRTDTAMDATHGNKTSLIPALILDKDDKQCCEIHESEIANDTTGSSSVLASQTCQEMECNKELLHPEQKDVAHAVPSTNVDFKEHERANDDLHIGSSKILKETSRQKSLDIQTFVEGFLAKDTDTSIKETSQQKSLDIQTSIEGILAKDTDTTIKETSQHKNLDIQTSFESVLAKDTDNNTKETSQQKSLDIQTSAEGVLAKDTDNITKESSQQKSLDIQTSVEGVLAKDTDNNTTETSQQKRLDIQTSVEGILAKDTDNTIKETSQQKILDIQASVEGVLAKDTNITIKETSQPKILDVQASFEVILDKDTDTTISGLNLPESSLEGFKLGTGSSNRHTEEKHPEKMKITLTTKTDQ